VVAFESGYGVVLPAEETQFEWSLHGNQYDDSNFATIYLQNPHSGYFVSVGEIEVLRQTEQDLFRLFNYSQPGGYLVIGRCTFKIISPNASNQAVASIQEERLDLLDGNERIKIAQRIPALARSFVPTYDSQEQLIRELSPLLVELYGRTGNASGPCDNLIGVSRPSQVLDMVTNGSATVQCTGIRDLFIEVALSCRLIEAACIRKVDAFRYREIPGIVVNAHSLLEVSHDGKAWFIFDPTTRTYFSGNDGKLLSAYDLQLLCSTGRLSSISIHVVETPADPYDNSILADIDPYNYNYWCHFNLLKYSRIMLPD
jgi:hypothetical protein